MIKKIIIIVLIVVAVLLSFLIYRSIMAPVKFDSLKKNREDIIVKKMKDLREIEFAFKSANRHFTSDFDSLSDFLHSGKLPTVVKTGVIPDTMTESQALKLGLITRDTIYDNAYEVLSKKFLSNISSKEDFVANLKFVPTTSRTEVFELSSGYIEKNGTQIPVIMCMAHVQQYMKGSDQQLVRNYIKLQEDINRYPGVKFGSMTEAQTEGNWE
jgi:hypothetical protein